MGCSGGCSSASSSSCRCSAPPSGRIGALTGALADVGIDDKFIDQVKSRVTPGTSALFTLTSGAVVDRVAEAFRGMQAQVVSTNLSAEQEDRLKEMFSVTAATPRA